MDKPDSTTKYADTLKQLKLSESSRSRIADNLVGYVDFHKAKEVASGQVRDTAENRSREQVSQTAVWYTAFFTRLHLHSMPLFTIAALLLIGGGTSLAAQGSLPGELLYPVKVGVNENIRLAFAVSEEAETEVQLALLEERVREAQTLQAEGHLDDELAVAVRTNVRTQAQAAHRASDNSDAVIGVAAKSGIASAVGRFNSLIGKDDRLTIATLVDAGARFESSSGATAGNGGSARAESSLAIGAPTLGKAAADMGVSTMLAVGPAPLSVLFENAQVHLDAVAEVIERHRAEIEAEQYAEFKATLDTATELMVRARVQSNEDTVRALVEEATMLVGEIEAALTLLGEATVDVETGAILDIDFSRKPSDGSGMIDIMPMPPVMTEPWSGQTEAGVGVDSVIDISNDMIEGTAAGESFISF